MNLLLPCYSVFVIFLLIFAFFSKERVSTAETKIYGILLITSSLNIIFNICGITLGYTQGASTFLYFLNHLDLPLYIILSSLLLLYLGYILLKNNKNKIYDKFKKIIILLDIIFILITFFLPLEVIIESKAGYAIGACVNFVYLISAIYLILCLIIAILLVIKRTESRKTLPIFMLVFLGIIAALVQKFIPSLIIVPSVMVFVLLLMYFTIENPDLKVMEELIENKNIIERSSEEKSMFFFKISQELRIPVMKIDKLIDEYKSSDAKRKDDIINEINSNNNKVNYLINDVVGVNSLSEKNIKKIENTYNIYSLLDNVKRRVELNIKKNVEFKFSIVSTMPKELYGDSIKLKQILTSVLMTVINNTENGFIYVDVNDITMYDISRLVISVKDSGEGIPIKTINEILEQDNDVVDDDIIEVNDLNIDLHLAYKLLRMLGGTMYIKSDPDCINKIFITLDQYIVVEKKKKNDNLTSNKLLSKRALILNDDEEETNKIKAFLKSKDYRVSVSLFGRDTIDKIKNGDKYDLILIDDEMPLMNGITVLEELNKIDDKSKKIVLLEKDKLFIAKQYMKDGFDDYIDKSDLINELDKKIK